MGKKIDEIKVLLEASTAPIKVKFHTNLCGTAVKAGKVGGFRGFTVDEMVKKIHDENPVIVEVAVGYTDEEEYFFFEMEKEVPATFVVDKTSHGEREFTEDMQVSEEPLSEKVVNDEFTTEAEAQTAVARGMAKAKTILALAPVIPGWVPEISQEIFQDGKVWIGTLYVKYKMGVK